MGTKARAGSKGAIRVAVLAWRRGRIVFLGCHAEIPWVGEAGRSSGVAIFTTVVIGRANHVQTTQHDHDA